MTGPQSRLFAIGLAALLLASPFAVETPAEVQDDASESDAFACGPGGGLARGPDPDARLLGVDAASVRGSFDPPVSGRSLSRPPPPRFVR